MKYQKHSETSMAAAESMASRAAVTRRRVYDFLLDTGPATDETIARALDMNPSTARPRRIELVELGSVVESGYKEINSSGREAVLWKVNLDPDRGPLTRADATREVLGLVELLVKAIKWADLAPEQTMQALRITKKRVMTRRL
jgi:hypothetical protein